MASDEWRAGRNEPHTPAMLQEVLEWLRIKPDGIYVDATLGAGGHSEAIAERLSSGRLISLDRDEQALQIARERLTRFGSKVNCVLSPFSRIAEAVHELGIPKVDGQLKHTIARPELATAVGLARYAMDNPDDDLDTGGSGAGWKERVRSLWTLFGGK